MIKRIFHFSDFHINDTCGDPKENPLFKALIQSINDNFSMEPGDSNYLVYTGDIIDARRFSYDSDEQYSERIKRNYNLAKSYFNELLRHLGIRPDHFIICPGNHDKSRLEDGSDNALCGKTAIRDHDISSDDIHPKYDVYSNSYKQYSDFVKSLDGKTYDYVTSIYEVDGFMFFIVNSTWKEKEAESDKEGSSLMKAFRRCIDCKGIVEQVNSHPQMVSDDVYNHILIAHDPLINWCENSILEYSESKDVYVHKYMDYFGFKLCGDVHADSEIGEFHSICSKLSSSKSASYGCIEYIDGKSEYITYSADIYGTSLKLDSKQKKEIVSLSSLSKETYYIKQLSLKFINGYETPVNSATIIKASNDLVEMYRKNTERWNLINDFFELFSRFREYNVEEKRISTKSNLLYVIAKELDKGENRVRLTIKSRPSQGKSTFLSLLYLYLLGLFFDNKFPFVPVYFNREFLIEKSFEEKKTIFAELVSKANEQGEKINRPICYIFDGFNEYNYFKNSFDDYVYENYLEFEDKESDKGDIYILSIDADTDRNMRKTHIGTEKLAQRVIYFRNVETKSLKTPAAEKFLSKLSELLNLDNGDSIAKSIRNSGMEYVDMNLVVRFGKSFAKGKDLVDIFESYGRKEKVFSKEDRDRIPPCSYHILFLNTKYNLLDKKHMVTHKTYCSLCRQRELGMYYCAKYYFNEIHRLGQNADEEIAPDSVLNNFFSHEQNFFLKKLREKNDLQPKELEFFYSHHFEKLSDLGKSQFIYLFGRKKSETGHSIFHNMDFVPERDLTDIVEKDERFKAEILNRTVQIIRAFEDAEKVEEFVVELLKNRIARRVNRAAHMLYYSDVKYENAKKIYYNNIIFKGLDIYHTFLILTNRIQQSDNSSIIKLLDLVTLCDLMEHRFRQPLAYAVNDDSVYPSYFYTDFYKESVDLSPQQILTSFIETIDQFNLETIKNEIIKVYIRKCRYDAVMVKQCFVDKDSFLSKDMFHQSNAYETIKRIELEERKGWKITTAIGPEATKECFDTYKDNPSLETVEQHIYQSYLIGLLYLPVEYPDKSEASTFSGSYNKQDVLNTLLIHDIGETKTGDWPVYFMCHEEVESEEDIFNKQLLIGGAYSETSNLLEYLKLWNNWSETEHGRGDINAVLSRELDKIQFLYRYNELKRANKLNHFQEDRHKQILSTRNKIRTSVGKRILKILVDDNPHFSDS